MAKKKTRDPEKRATLAAKKEAKQDKSARKRIAKETGGTVDGEDSASSADDEDDGETQVDIDRLLRKYKQQDAAALAASDSASRVVSCDGFPLARAHATLTVTMDDKKKKDAYLFGGEYHDGAHTVVSDQLFKYELATNKWKQIISSSATSPPPRCSHAAAYYNKHVYIFGGEHYTPGAKAEYHHYKDVWKFDTVSQQWSEVKPSGITITAAAASTPSARSGTAMAVWKQYLILFGGFTETAADPLARWYNDIYVLNLQTEQWLSVPHSRLSVRPESRSACHTALLSETDQWLIHGGFSKLATSSRQQQQQQPASIDDAANTFPASETIVHTDAWVLHLRPLLEDKPPTWERWTSSLSKAKRAESAQSSPNGRSGVGAIAYSNHMLLFGGVVDQELHHHKMESVFFNDLALFHVERRKFVPIRLAEVATAVSKKSLEDEHVDDDEAVTELVRKNDENQPVDPSGWDLNKLRSNMFAFVDGDGNVIYEKIDTVKDRLDRERNEKKQSHETIVIERTEPLPRIKPCLFLNGHTLYVYGGLVEVGDREVTLDDMWSIDLRKNRKWQCIFPGTMHEQVWRGAVNDDDDSYYSGSNNNSYSNSNTAGSKVELANALSDHDDEEEEETKEEEKAEKPAFRSSKDEMIYLVETHNLGDEEQSPQPQETFDDFYARTREFWDGKCKKLDKGKQAVEQGGSKLARTRYESLEPIIERIMELKLQRKEEKSRKAKSDQK